MFRYFESGTKGIPGGIFSKVIVYFLCLLPQLAWWKSLLGRRAPYDGEVVSVRRGLVAAEVVTAWRKVGQAAKEARY